MKVAECWGDWGACVGWGEFGEVESSPGEAHAPQVFAHSLESSTSSTVASQRNTVRSSGMGSQLLRFRFFTQTFCWDKTVTSQFTPGRMDTPDLPLGSQDLSPGLWDLKIRSEPVCDKNAHHFYIATDYEWTT